MVDVTSRETLRLSEVARQLGVNYLTVWNWHKHGLQGIRLATTTVGGRRYTTRAALDEFSRRARDRRGPMGMAKQQAAESDGARAEPQTGEPAAAN